MPERFLAEVTYDEDTDTWCIDLRTPLSQTNVSRTVTTTRTVNLDYGIRDDLLGIEIL